MTRNFDTLERSRNHTRGYRRQAKPQSVPTNFVFIPRYVKYIIPAIQIGLGVMSAVLIGIMVLT